MIMSRDSSLEDSIALITSAKNDTGDFGSSFIIKKTANATYWLTCAHVVLDVGGINNLRIAGHSAALVGCSEDELGAVKDTYDIVVLKVEALIKKVPLELAHLPKQGSSFSVTGHYQNQGAKQIFAESLYGRLSISDIGLSTSEGYFKTLKLEVDSESKLSFQPGYSGSPVLSEGKKQVIGVVSQKHTDGRVGIAISVEAVKHIFKKVPELQDILIESQDTLIRKSYVFTARINNFLMTTVESSLLENLSPDVQEALNWLRCKGEIAQQASDHVADTLPSFKNIADDVKLRNLQDLSWDIERYLGYVYDSLLTNTDERLTQQTIKPSRPLAEYEMAFLWVKDNIPSNINYDTAENIRKNLDCISSNISYR
jgi:Trypsin-like peptidase domain